MVNSAGSTLAALAAAGFGGLIAQRLGMPGGLVVGAMLGAGAFSVTYPDPHVGVPEPLQTVSMLIVGAAIGSKITRGMFAELHSLLLPAVLSAVLLIIAGLGIAYLLQALGFAPLASILATSPGALSSIAVLAAERGAGAAEVAVFHTIRVVLVVLSLPGLLALMPGTGR